MIKRSTTSRPGNRTPALFALCALTLALTACSDGGGDSPATVPPATATPATEAPTSTPLGGDVGTDTTDTSNLGDTSNPGDTSSPGGTVSFPGGNPFAGGGGGDDDVGDSTDFGDDEFPSDDGDGFPGDDDFGGDTEITYEFECGGDTIIAAPGDTVICGGTTYEITEDGEAVAVNGTGTGGGGAPAGDLAAALTNTVVSEDEFDLWVCTVDAHTYPVAYFFVDGGLGLAAHLDEDEGFSAEFTWTTQGNDTVFLNYDAAGAQEEINQISFSSDGAAWSGFSSSEGAADCEIFFFEG